MHAYGYRRWLFVHDANIVLYRPKEFAKKSTYVADSDEEESTVGKMPPSDSDEE